MIKFGTYVDNMIFDVSDVLDGRDNTVRLKGNSF